MGKSSQNGFIDVSGMPLEEWLTLLSVPPAGARFIAFQFPTDKLRDDYIATIGQRSEEEVQMLLRHFLMVSGSLGVDRYRITEMESTRKASPETFSRMMKIQYYQRLWAYSHGVEEVQPWEGITWVLDLLPDYPKQALEGLDAYIYAHLVVLPDGRMNGLSDACEVIRARYIGLPGSQAESAALLINLLPREFECLVERLYNHMGYDTELTPPSKDGGRDVIAIKREPGQRERLLIECKRHIGPVGVRVARALLGVVSNEKATKGVLVTTSRFTSGADELAAANPRLELINGEQLVRLLNEHLGPKWPLHIERYVRESDAKR